MSRSGYLSILVLLVAFGYSSPLPSQEITPSHVFQVTATSISELEALLKHRSMLSVSVAGKMETRHPRHVWQRGREILIKIQRIQTKLGLVSVPLPVVRGKDFRPRDVKKLADRALRELRRLCVHFGLNDRQPAAAFESGKNPTDVYVNMDYISAMLGRFASKAVEPSDVYQIAITIKDALYRIALHRSGIVDLRDVARSQGKRPKDVYWLSQRLLIRLKALSEKNAYKVPGGVILPKEITGSIRPKHVLELTENILAEIIAMEYALGIRVTADLVSFEANKTPSDVFYEINQSIALVEALL